MNTDLENKINNNILNLKIISSLNKDDKLTISDNEISIENNDFSQAIRRWWNSQSRSQSLDQIECVINEAFSITDTIFEEESKNFEVKEENESFKEENSSVLQRYLIELKGVHRGLDNLKLTYNEYVTIISHINILQ